MLRETFTTRDLLGALALTVVACVLAAAIAVGFVALAGGL
jgi:high-affinity Fe2+/Pb2+ permease